jgi:YfiH family protein
LKYSSPYASDNIIIIRPKIFVPFPSVRAGSSVRYGISDFQNCVDPDVEMERNILFPHAAFSKLDLNENMMAFPKQCHSVNILKIEEPGEYERCDALITDARLVAVAVKTADCVPVLIYDPDHRSAAAVHAGWRGTAGKIVKNTIEEMRKYFGTRSSRVKVYIGPSAGPCCYEVGEEVAVLFDNKLVSCNGKKISVDLKQENFLQLQDIGVPAGSIEMSRHCTICGEKLFHSFRRDGIKSGRMITAICIIS